MSGFGEKSMEKALDEAAKGHDDFMPGNRPINYGGGKPYDIEDAGQGAPKKKDK